MWGEDNPKMGSLDQMQTILQKKALQYSVCPIATVLVLFYFAGRTG